MLSRLRAFARPEQQVLSIEVLAEMGPPERAEQGQLAILVRHLLDRFFNNEMTSSDDEGKTRLIQLACAAGLPGFVAAMYLWPVYHDILRRHRPYWARVSDHYLFVVYSMVAMGIIMVFEWDLFFPDLLDIFVLSSLPIKDRKLFLARIATVFIFIVGFLFDANILSTLALPAAIDPPSLERFLAAHVLAVAGSGIFAAATVLAVQGTFLALLGARLFRRISLPLQGLFITALLMILFLYPALSGALPVFMHSTSQRALYFPPFWFLGIYQRVLEGPSALPIYMSLARTGCTVTLWVVAVAILSYPLAYWRRTRELVEGSGTRDTRSVMGRPINRMLHTTLLRAPVRRAIYHFISQTLPRVQRYRIYLVMYGGLGLSLIVATVLRLHVWQRQVRMEISPDGLRAAIPMAVFWTIAGLRMAFVSPTDPRGRWIFQTIQGRPQLEQLTAAKTWVLLWSIIASLAVVAALHMLAAPELRGWKITSGQVLVATGLCLLLTDAFFLNVKILPFTGVKALVRTNLAIVLLKYVAAFVPVVVIVVKLGPWIESSVGHLATSAPAIAGVHFTLQVVHRKIVADHLKVPDLDEDQQQVFQTLGLRY
ncbi:MAG: hypothetical protein ACYCOX_02740 [Acidobacteriaceae bacterium]